MCVVWMELDLVVYFLAGFGAHVDRSYRRLFLPHEEEVAKQSKGTLSSLHRITSLRTGLPRFFAGSNSNG